MDDHSQRSPAASDQVVVAIAMVLPSAITWVYFFWAAGMTRGVQAVVFSVVKVIQFALPILWYVFMQRGRVSLRPSGPQGVALGLAFGAIVGGALFALYAGFLKGSNLVATAMPEIQTKVAGFGIDSAWKYALLGGFYSLIHSFMEEYYWRWFVFDQLTRWMPVGTAALVSGVGFMSHHVLVLGKFFGFANPATYLLSSCIAVGGIVWALLYRRTGSLLGPWLSHMLVDAAIFAVGYDLVRPMLAH